MTDGLCHKRHGRDVMRCEEPAGHDKAHRKPMRRGARPKAVSDKQEQLNKRWSFIRACFIYCQRKTDGYLSCMECGQVFDDPKDLDLDHVISRARGGDYSPANAALLCRACHSGKHGNPQWSESA